MASRHEGDHYFAGNLNMQTLTIPAGTIANAAIAAGAAIAASKVVHQQISKINQPNTTATTETRPLHVVYGATGTILSFKAGSIVACVGAATITVDLKKNGASILSAPITLDSSNTARIMEAATVSNTALVVGDFLEVVITATAGGGTIGTGFFCELVHTEDPS